MAMPGLAVKGGHSVVRPKCRLNGRWSDSSQVKGLEFHPLGNQYRKPTHAQAVVHLRQTLKGCTWRRFDPLCRKRGTHLHTNEEPAPTDTPTTTHTPFSRTKPIGERHYVAGQLYVEPLSLVTPNSERGTDQREIPHETDKSHTSTYKDM